MARCLGLIELDNFHDNVRNALQLQVLQFSLNGFLDLNIQIHTQCIDGINKGAVAGFVPTTESNLRTAMGSVEICNAFYYPPHLQTACKDIFRSV